MHYVIIVDSGEMAEWSKAPDSKSGIRQRIGGSNPSLSASILNKCHSPARYRFFLIALRPFDSRVVLTSLVKASMVSETTDIAAYINLPGDA